MLTLRGGPDLVAIWGQLSSVIELVAGVALAGVGTGISVLVAQSAHADQQRELLRESLRLGLALSAAAMILVAAICWSFPDHVAGSGVSSSLLVLAAAVGCLTVIPGMVNGYWLGRQHRDLMLALALVSAALPLAASMSAPQTDILGATAFAFAVPALVVLFVTWRRSATPDSTAEWRHSLRLLRRYVPAGLVIGILSPASMLAARTIVSSAMSWHDTALLQSLWRISDWVGSVAAGILSVYFLPKLAAAYETPQFDAVLKRAAWMTIGPSALVLALLLGLQQPILSMLYDRSFRIPDATVALFLAGSLVRIAAWVPLFALYAKRRTLAIVLGEFLSLPLFALLLGVFSEGLTLELLSVLWLASYLAYGAFNLCAVRARW